MKKNIFLITFIILTINGCVFQKIKPIKEKNPEISLPTINRITIPMPPKIKKIDWHTTLAPMVKQISSIKDIIHNSILLINNMKNSTNGLVQTMQATSTLNNLITAEYSYLFKVIDNHKIHEARYALAILAEDNLESFSKAMGLARYLNANYVLYSVASGKAEQPIINIQLILVKTGEIIWTSSNLARN